MHSDIRRPLPFLLVGLLSVSAQARQEKAKDAPTDITCRFISLGPAGKGKVRDVAKELAGIGPGISVKAVPSDSMLACAGTNAIDGVVAAVKAAVGVEDKADPPRNAPETHYTRLYFNRNASALAEAITGTYDGLEVKALGPDLLIFKSKERTDEAHIHELKQWIASMDSPRPEIALNAWSVQVSAPTEKDVEEISRGVRKEVSVYNEQLKRAFQNGWLYLNSVHNSTTFPMPRFGGYVLKQYEADKSAFGPYERFCGKDTYCLGYGATFTSLMQPSLSNFIGILSAAKDSSHIDKFVDCLESRTSCGISGRLGAPGDSFTRKPLTLPDKRTCEDQDEAEYSDKDKKDSRNVPAFYCFRKELTGALTTPARRALLRTAMADFLFHYKFSLQYPHALEPFEYAASAQVLDAQLNPLLSAFNRDMAAYLRGLQNTILPDNQGHIAFPLSSKNPGDIKFLSNGIVTLRTISGTESSVDSATQNAFRETPPPLAQEFVKNLTEAETKIPSLISANLAPHAAAALTAFLSSGQSPVISLGRDLNLKVTPTSLQGASSAELKVHLEAKDDGQPKRIKPDGTSQDDTTDRVANHTVDTNVRVDSLGLFEISTLSAELSRAREPIPLLPPFVELPYIRSFLQYKPSPGKVYHRSFVILSATILPTAADLLNGMRFEHDQVDGKSVMLASNDKQDETAKPLRGRHKKILYCIAQEANLDSKPKDDVKERAIDCDHPGREEH